MGDEGPDFIEKVARALRWFERAPLASWVAEAELARALRAAVGGPEGAARAAERVGARFDEVVARLRGSDRSVASLLGQDMTDALVRLAGEAEPDEQMIRALFAERASEALLASLLYDGIIEFMRKMNSLGDQIPGMSFAKKLGGGLFGGLAGGRADWIGEQLEKRLGPQVKTFLAGFVKIALERGVKFVTSPANKQTFRDAREKLARAALERKAAEWLAGVPGDRIARVRDELIKIVRARHEDLAAESGPRSASELVRRAIEKGGAQTVGALADKYALLRLDPETVAKIIAPAIARALQG